MAGKELGLTERLSKNNNINCYIGVGWGGGHKWHPIDKNGMWQGGAKVKWKSLSCVRLYATPWTVQSMKLSRPEFRSGWKWKVKVKVTQLCPALYDPMDYTVHGVLQARILEWVAFPFSRGSSQSGVGSLSLLQEIFPTQGLNPGLPHCRWILYQLSHKGGPRQGGGAWLFYIELGLGRITVVKWRWVPTF